MGGAAPEDRDARLRAALPALALGDALGAPFEGRGPVPPREVDAWVAAEAPLRWTDDTHMALGLGRSLVATGGRIVPDQLGDTFASAFAAEPWRGYGAGPPRVFARVREGATYEEAAVSLFGGTGSYGNGAAMRVAPVALAAGDDPDRAAALARAQARVTHAHPEALDGAVAVAVAVVLLARAGDGRAAADALADLPRWLATPAVAGSLRAVQAAGEGTGALAAARAAGCGVAARESVPAAVGAFLAAPSDLTDTVRAAVGLGGDTDTIAAMAAALAGARLGPRALPGRLLARLEARDELEALAAALTDGSR